MEKRHHSDYKYAIYGGSFDPIHRAHVSLAYYCTRELDLDELYFVPTFVNPFKQGRKGTPADDRVKMIESILHYDPTFRVSDVEARKIAKTVVGSPLVKTAVFGNDANWGRIIAAVGYSGATVDPEKIAIKIGPALMVEDGEPIPFSEEELIQILKANEVKIYVSLGQGDGHGLAWGCDLTYDYVQINASYRS